MDYIPNSPAELLAMHAVTEETTEGNEFLEIVEDMFNEVDPEPQHLNEVAMFLIAKLERYNFEVANSDDPEVDAWQRKLYADDMQRFTEALAQLRAVNPE